MPDETKTCECPARNALERLKGAGDRKVLDGSVMLSAPFLDSLTAALSAPCQCAGLRAELAASQERERKLRSDLHAQCGRVLDLEREARNSDYSVKKELDALVKQREEAQERERVLREALRNCAELARSARLAEPPTIYKDFDLGWNEACDKIYAAVLKAATPEGTRDE